MAKASGEWQRKAQKPYAWNGLCSWINEAFIGASVTALARSMCMAIVSLLAAQAWGTVSAADVLDPRKDPRLNRLVRIEVASITLGELAKAVYKQTRVVWRVPDRWRETRMTIYAPERPLKELMEGVVAALPVLEWRVRKFPNRPVEYALQQTQPLEDEPPPPSRSALVKQIKRSVELLRLHLSAPRSEHAESYTEAERRAAESLLAQLNRSTFVQYLHELTNRTGIEWLLQLTEADWQALKQRGAITRWFNAESPLGASILERARALANRYRQFHDDEAAELDRATEFIGELRLTEAGDLYFYLASAEGMDRQLQGNMWVALLLSIPQFSASLVPAAVPQLPEWREPLPPPPPSVQEQANWYNELGCLLLELAHAARRPLVAPLFPFYTVGESPPNTQLYANTLMWSIVEFRLPEKDLPRLLWLASMKLVLRNDWLIGQSTNLARAVDCDIPDSRLQQWFPMPAPADAAWLAHLLNGLANLNQYNQPMLLNRLRLATIKPVYEHVSRYALRLDRTPGLQWSFRSGWSLQKKNAFGEYEQLFEYAYAGSELDSLLMFWRALPHEARLRALSGDSIPVAELPGQARAQFVQLFQQTPLLNALIQKSASHEARFRIVYSPALVECAIPDRDTQQKLLRADRPIEAWYKWYYEELSPEEFRKVRRVRVAPQWIVQFDWGDWRIECRIQRAVCGAWLTATAK